MRPLFLNKGPHNNHFHKAIYLKENPISTSVNNSSNIISLRPVLPTDLDVFFRQQLEPEGIRMAAFTPKDPSDRAAFDALWQKTLADPDLVVRTVLYGEQIAGFVVYHTWFGSPEVGGWIGKEFWSKGIATHALTAFLDLLPIRPLYAHTAAENLGSLRVLEKCGFRVIGSEKSFANGRGEEVEEMILELKG